MNFETLSGKRALGTAHAKDYTTWAETLLYDDVESENVAILAGMGLDRNPDSPEVEFYFQRCLKDLGLVLPSRDKALRNYALYLCRQIIADELFPRHGLEILQRFYFQSNYEDTLFSIWDELSEDVYLVESREGSIFNSGISAGNIEKYIKSVAVQFIRLCGIELPRNFFRFAVCRKCRNISEPKLERVDKPWLPVPVFRLFHRRSPTQRTICASCREPFPLNMSDYEAREHYLKAMC